MKRFARACLGALLVAGAASANAGLVGTTVFQCADTVRNAGAVTTDISVCPNGVQPSPGSAVVGAGVEFALAGRQLDLGDDTLTISYSGVGSASPDLYIFYDLAEFVTGMSLVSSNPLDATFTFSGDRFAVQIGAPLVDGSVSFRLQFGDNQVPEPSSLALILSAGALMTLSRRRKPR